MVLISTQHGSNKNFRRRLGSADSSPKVGRNAISRVLRAEGISCHYSRWVQLPSEPPINETGLALQRLAVLPEQIAAWPEQPVDPPCKYRDTGLFSVAPPDDLHDHVRQVIEEHLPFEEFEILRIAKENDRQAYHKWDPWEWRPG